MSPPVSEGSLRLNHRVIDLTSWIQFFICHKHRHLVLQIFFLCHILYSSSAVTNFFFIRFYTVSYLSQILALLITVAVGHGKGWSRGCRGWGNCHRGPTCADPTQIPNSEATAGTLGASCSSSAFSYYYRSQGTCSMGLQCCINNQGATLCERKRN